MKRPFGIWILLSAGVLWLSFQDVYGIRATALIFGKSTTTPAGPVANVTDGNSEVVTESSTATSNVTKPTLTGNPQLDYIHDPNLPKELNGYNLSEYPFYERVPDPDEIDFKCDGLHDGFYASITFKCQVYHHCLFGTRYDFLCANYTAFDQKTFICQFVSDVDCVGSKKFWHRNDALYQAASTTTQKPLNIYTTSPQPNPGKGGGGPRGGGKLRGRRPFPRRPQYDYYDDADYEDDYYEDRPRTRGRRPRPRPRPVYEDEYEEDYEEEAYERRNRRPYNRRGGSDRKRNKNRNKNKEVSPEDDVSRPKDRKKPAEADEEDYRSTEKRKVNRHDKFEDDRSNERRKPSVDDKFDDETRNAQQDERPSETRKPSRDDKFESERTGDKRKPPRDDSSEDEYVRRPQRPRKATRRPPPIEDEYEDDLPKNQERRENRPRKKFEDDSQEAQPLIKPTTGTIYDRPRVAPRIKPPVPKNEANKYAYKPISKTTSAPLEDEEYYDDYEEDPPQKASNQRKNKADTVKPNASETKERKQAHVSSRSRTKTLDQEDDALTLPHKTKTKTELSRGKERYNRPSPKTTEEPVFEEYEEPPKQINEKKVKNPINHRHNSEEEKSKVPEADYFDDYEIEKTTEELRTRSTQATKQKWRPSTEASTSTTTTTRTTTRLTTTSIRTTSAPTSSENYKERPEQIVRILKRPFLPSRGGNPYSPRGLQPVGFKATKSEVMEPQSSVDVQQKSKDLYTTAPSTFKPNKPEAFSTNKQKNTEDSTQPSVNLNKGNSRQKFNQPIQEVSSKVKPKFSEPISENDDDFKPVQRPQNILKQTYDGNDYTGPRTTQKPKVPERNPLDITENDYDVTLNDALNPTLPNLPVRPNYPSGFSPANDYTFSAFQRPRYVLEPIANPPNTDYTYHSNQPVASQRFEAVPQSYNSRDQYVAPSNDYKNYYTQVVGRNSKRGITQAQTQPFYSTSY